MLVRVKQKYLIFGLVTLLSIILITCNRQSDNQADFVLAESDLAVYESDIDHAGLIKALDKESFRRGRDIYGTVCFTCHGDADLPGSLPNSFRFWDGNFQVGIDPYSMYQTVSRGFGGMPPQVHLVPQQKYDVIHFIRENFVKNDNQEQYFELDESYMQSLPKGSSPGPEAKKWEPWADMDYGDFLIYTYELAGLDAKPRERSLGRKTPLPDEDFGDANFAYKGIAVRLDKGPGGVAAGKSWMIFDHDLLRVAGGWTGEGFIDWRSILFNGEHNISPRTVGDLHFSNPVGPGWANPKSGSFDDPRFRARDGRAFGPLPREWAHYKGLYHYEDRAIIEYTVGVAKILETLGMEELGEQAVFTRTLNVTPSSDLLRMRIAPEGTEVAVTGEGGKLKRQDGFVILEMQKNQAAMIKVFVAKGGTPDLDQFAQASSPPESLQDYTSGSPARNSPVSSLVTKGNEDGPFAVDILTPPYENPWNSRMRLSGIDFYEDDNNAVASCTEGDVWIIEGLKDPSGVLTWTRIATGLFQPLGIKLIDGEIYVTCRDQMVILRDLNGDRETDFYESFNNDHQVTDHFHEFAMGLQVDEEGNLYYAKSGRHAREALVPQHGTLIRVSADGSKTDIVAKGFRAANGVCLNPDGTFIVTDQEGFWNPMNRINWVEEGKFYGNMWCYDPPADSSDQGMEQPLAWVDEQLDRSPAELVWIDTDKWGPLKGNLLNISYGYGKIFLVLHEEVNGQKQGGLFELPIPRLPTGVMRGRFHPSDGQLYVCGLSAWSTTQMLKPGGLYRVRYTGHSLRVPLGIEAVQSGLILTFSDKLDPEVSDNTSNYQITTWDLKRTRKYGSEHYNTQTLEVAKAELEENGTRVRLTIPAIEPTWAMDVKFNLSNANGEKIEGFIQNTIHNLRSESEESIQATLK